MSSSLRRRIFIPTGLLAGRHIILAGTYRTRLNDLVPSLSTAFDAPALTRTGLAPARSTRLSRTHHRFSLLRPRRDREGILRLEVLMIAVIDEFLAQPRLAIVGVSHEPKHFSADGSPRVSGSETSRCAGEPDLMRGKSRARRAIRTYRTSNRRSIRLSSMTPPAVTDEVVKDCADARNPTHLVVPPIDGGCGVL